MPVPRVGARLDPGVEPAGRDPGQLERAPGRRGGAGRSRSRRRWPFADARQDEAVLAQEEGDVGLVSQGSAGADGEPARRCSVAPCAARGGEQLAQRVVDGGGERAVRRRRGRRRCTSRPGGGSRRRPCRRSRRGTSGGPCVPPSLVPSSPRIASSGQAARMIRAAASSARASASVTEIGGRRPVRALAAVRCAPARPPPSPPARRQSRLTGRIGL